jgi:Ca2+-binding RTX toxin-like protein
MISYRGGNSAVSVAAIARFRSMLISSSRLSGREVLRGCSGTLKPMQGRVGVVIGVVVGLWSPALASGSTVSVDPVAESEEIFYTAGGGEENDVVLSTNGATVTVHDPGAQIQAGNDCVAVGQHTATCNFNGFAPINLDLRRGDDRGRITGPMIRLSIAKGGAGRDRLVGAGFPDRFDGGRGPDAIIGKGSSDLLFYTGRPDDLRVTLGDGKRNDGGPRDGALRDRLKGIEGALGGDGHDVLVGSGVKNDLFGGAGPDTIRGKAGADNLGGQDGRDRSFGGPGGDLFPGDSGKDTNVGGTGPDLFQGGSANNGADLFRGGGGHDQAQYVFGHVRLSLDGEANDGACANPACTSSNEGDNLISIEELSATFGRDVLIGSGRDEVFHPFPGADVVRAKGGDDDVHLSIDGDVDDVDCGAGEDLILGMPDAFDMNKNCE